MEKDKDFLGTEPIGKLLLRLAIPTLAAQLINMLYNVVDLIYIGHIPKVGALALTGVGVCMPLIMIVSAFAVLVGNGGAPRASIYMGQNNKEDAEKTLGNCFATQILVAIVLTIVLLLGNRTFLLAFGASENTISYAAAYMNIYAVGTIFVQLTLGLNAFITAQGFAKTGMLSVLIGAVINIVLDPIFIFGLHMGVRGAALATIISQACSCIWVVSFLFGKKTFLKIQRKNMKLEARIILPSLALGLATFIMQASESIITVCFNSSLLKYGGDIAGGAMTILPLAYLPSVEYFAHLLCGGCVVDLGEHFVKRSERNRARILATDGVMELTVHVCHANRPRQPVRDVRIDYSKRWQHQHWGALVASYKGSPYFDFYAEYFEPFYRREYGFLADYNAELLGRLCSLLRVPMPEFSQAYVAAAAGDTDLRPKRRNEGPAFIAEPYVQVFSDRMPFQPNLSVADLLFAEGPEAVSVLRRCRL